MDQHRAPAPDADQRWMRRALAVAESSRGLTGPNPFVGAVVIADGVEIAAGATGPTGSAHAEPRALTLAGDLAVGATLYVTLAPCAHHGRTPPCTEAIIAADVARVVIGLVDPNPVAGGGVEVLTTAGIDVRTGVLADRVATQLTAFTTSVTRDRPHITGKIAQTVEGITDPRHLGSRWITGKPARRRVHELRAEVAGVLVGSETVLADDPALTVRDAPPPWESPRPVVMDRRGRLTADLAVVRSGTIVLTGPESSSSWRDMVTSHGAEVVVVDSIGHGLHELVGRDVTAVLAEPGPTLATVLLSEQVVDRQLVHVADSSVTDGTAVKWSVPVVATQAVSRRRCGQDVEWEFLPDLSTMESPPQPGRVR